MSDQQALKDIKKDIYLMIHKAGEMLELTEDAFMKSKLSALDEAREISREIKLKEDLLTEKLAKAAAANSEARAILSVPVQIEKIAVSIERVMDNIRMKIQEGILFSDKAILESGKMISKGKEVLKKAGEAMVTGNAATVETVKNESEAMIKMSTQYATAHEERLVTGECAPKSSSTYLCMLYAFEDLAAHTRDVLAKITGK
jgi:Na+/phosphate symporter